MGPDGLRWGWLGLAGALFGAAMLEALTVNVYFHALFRCAKLGVKLGLELGVDSWFC
jgi:hypothetical protein